MDTKSSAPSSAPYFWLGAALVVAILIAWSRQQAKAKAEEEAAAAPARALSAGFTLASDCSHLVMTDPIKFKASIESVIAANPGATDAAGVDKITRLFFDRYFASLAAGCVPATGLTSKERIAGVPGSAEARFPSAAPRAQQVMYAAIFTGVAMTLIQANPALLASLDPAIGLLVAMLKTSGVTEAVWNEVLGGTLPMPASFKAKLG